MLSSMSVADSANESGRVPLIHSSRGYHNMTTYTSTINSSAERFPVYLKHRAERQRVKARLEEMKARLEEMKVRNK